MNKSRLSDTYSYLFEWAPRVVNDRLGACHGLELPFVFGTLRAPWLRVWLGISPRAQKLCSIIQDSWIAFARGGSPAHARLPDWPVYSEGARSTMAFGHECTLREDPHERGRLFWHPILREGFPSIEPRLHVVAEGADALSATEEAT